MAIFRKIHVSFWSDPFIAELDINKKYFYLYLLTNERSKQCGIYEIQKRQISFDTGLSLNEVSDCLRFFEQKGKIKYSESTFEIALKNWAKYNISTSPKLLACVKKEYKDVKNKVLIQYVNGIDTLSQEEQEQEEDKEKEQDSNLDTLNSSIMQDFDTFYQKYDKDVGKQQAQSAWSMLSPEDKQKVLSNVDDYVRVNSKKFYRLNPSRYLNERRFEDELIAPDVDIKGNPIDRAKHPDFPSDKEYHYKNIYYYENGKPELMT